MKNLFIKIVLLAMASIMTMSCGNKGGDTPSPSGQTPVVGATLVQGITSTMATVNVIIDSPGSSSPTAAGIEINGTKMPTSNLSATGFSVPLVSLSPKTAYTIRAYATNAKGTAYGASTTFTTLQTGVTFSDVDGNVYQADVINGDTWALEDLKVLRYRDLTPIPNVPVNSEWSVLNSGAYRYYNNSSTNKSVLYNYYVAINPKNVAPVGWHVATDPEWARLISYLGGSGTAGGKMKVPAGNWTTPNIGATNSSGFNALSTGTCSSSGIFSGMGLEASWWSTNLAGAYYYASNSTTFLDMFGSEVRIGRAIRVVKDK